MFYVCVWCGVVYGFILYVVLVLDSGWFELWLVVFVIGLLVWGLVGVEFVVCFGLVLMCCMWWVLMAFLVFMVIT